MSSPRITGPQILTLLAAAAIFNAGRAVGIRQTVEVLRAGNLRP